MTDERRAFQRLNLTEPVDGSFAGAPLRIVEVSARGVLATVNEPLAPGARGTMHFHWRGEDVESDAAVVWCEEDRAGFRFDEIPPVLRRLLEESVTELLKSAAGESAAADVFVTYTLHGGVWTRRTSLRPDQPPDGFTVAPSEPHEYVELLCHTFEHGDAETQRLTRLFAELSVTRMPLIR